MYLKILYEAQSVEEVKELLKLTQNTDSVIELSSKKVAEVLHTTETKESEDEEVEEEKAYTVEDLQALAVKANTQGKLSEVKAILDKHSIERVSEVPKKLLNTVGASIEGLVG